MVPSVFAQTVQETQIWLKEVMNGGALTDEHRAYAALRAVMHHLRDRLPVDQAADLGAQLPMLVRGIYYEGWDPSGTPTKDRKREDFIEAVRANLSGHPEIDPEIAIRQVFGVLSRHVTAGEIRDVISDLPQSVRGFWPQQAA
jgi:uncharacterized protein (DUF2267 family)